MSSGNRLHAFLCKSRIIITAEFHGGLIIDSHYNCSPSLADNYREHLRSCTVWKYCSAYNWREICLNWLIWAIVWIAASSLGQPMLNICLLYRLDLSSRFLRSVKSIDHSRDPLLNRRGAIVHLRCISYQVPNKLYALIYCFDGQG